MTILDEMADFGNYQDMVFVEFIEFIGRVSELLIKKDSSLVLKIEHILSKLLRKMLNVQIVLPDIGDH